MVILPVARSTPMGSISMNVIGLDIVRLFGLDCRFRFARKSQSYTKRRNSILHCTSVLTMHLGSLRPFRVTVARSDW